jgi:SAM-dependent methyltransferase
MKDVLAAFYPEIAAGGFTRSDGTVQFYQRIRALLRPRDVVLDFGAGRGMALFQDKVSYRINLRDLRGDGRRVVGVDVGSSVSTNPSLDEAMVIDAADPLPFPNATFDLIMSDSTFEHVADTAAIASELDRVLKPGGWLCARTPNRHGYVALINRLLPERFGNRLLSAAQPDRLAKDVFPALYRMNTLGTLKMLFPVDRYQHASFAIDSEPRYHFNRSAIFFLLLLLHTVTPPALKTTLLCFLQKRR